MKARWPRPDFLESRQRAPVLAWVWAATAALVLTTTLADGLALQRRIDAQAERLSLATQRLAARTPVRSPPAGARSAAAAKFDPDAARTAQRLSAQLDHPWGLILASVESETPAGMQWLLFDHASDSAELRLEGLGADVASALQVADALSAHVGWSDVALGRMQAPDAPSAPNAPDVPDARRPTAAGPLWRFELRAVLDAQRIAATRSDTGP